jgi:DNA-binding NtrC family response regulator
MKSRLWDDAVGQLSALPWPGNVRELQNALARVTILCRGRIIQMSDLESGPAPAASQPAGSFVLWDILAETERHVIAQALEHEGWNRTRAAQLLGISRRQLFDKIQQYGLEKWLYCEPIRARIPFRIAVAKRFQAVVRHCGSSATTWKAPIVTRSKY